MVTCENAVSEVTIKLRGKKMYVHIGLKREDFLIYIYYDSTLFSYSMESCRRNRQSLL